MKTRREPREEPRTLPSIDVVVVNSRGVDNPWFKHAVRSVHGQSYPCGLLIVDNNDRALSIGAAYNMAVQESNADLICFLGDDDWMEPDLVASMEACMDMARRQNDGVVIHLTTFCTAVIEHLGKMGQVQLPHMGMFRRDFLLEHPFNEELEKNVGGEMFRRLNDTSKFLGKPVTAAVVHHYGYMYRQHIGQASGMKVNA
jgi:glycosyltransferase involved in cell wall biosynthesis